jgi:hypothetical protein
MKACRVLALSFALAIPACGGSDPQSPVNASSISGTVVFDQTGSPAAGVDVILERHAGTTMMGDRWDQTGHMMTNSHGQFHFEYTHDPMHRYRVGVGGMSDWHMCGRDGRDEDGVVLRIPSQSP